MKIRILFKFIALFFYSLNSFAEDALWDLDTIVNQVKNYPAINLNTNAGVSQTLSKDYIYKLDEIRKKISQQSGVYPKFIISSSREVNAGATWHDGQPVTVFNLGLLTRIGEDYDAVAAVVSHEFSHLTLRHQQSQQTTNAVVDILAGLALIAIDSKYGGQNRNPYHGLYQTGLDLTATLAKTSYSRSEELEADSQGVKYMAAAGFSPEGAIRLQERIIPSSSSFFSTHPSSESRIQNIKVAMNSNPTYINNVSIAQGSNRNQSSENSFVDSASTETFYKTCEDIGFKSDTNQFGDCVFKLSGKKIQPNKKNTNSLIAKNTNDNEVYSSMCEEIGFRLGGKGYENCISRLKGNLSSTSKSLTITDKTSNNNFPLRGQIGSVITSNSNEGYVIFASSIQKNIPEGTKVRIIFDGNTVNGVVSKYYDGYYSANVDKTVNIKQGSRIIISN